MHFRGGGGGGGGRLRFRDTSEDMKFPKSVKILTYVFVCVSVPVSMVSTVVGLESQGECPFDAAVPNWLLIGGIAILLGEALVFLCAKSDMFPGFILCLSMIGLILVSSWIIFGCALLFEGFAPWDREVMLGQAGKGQDPLKYCSALTYVTYIVVLGVWLVAVVGGVIACCIFCFTRDNQVETEGVRKAPPKIVVKPKINQIKHVSVNQNVLYRDESAEWKY